MLDGLVDRGFRMEAGENVVVAEPPRCFSHKDQDQDQKGPLRLIAIKVWVQGWEDRRTGCLHDR